MGRLCFVGHEPTTAETSRHGFDRVSKEARADPRLSDRAYRVLATLEGYCWGEDRESWPSNRTLGLKSGGVGPEAIRRALRELERLGYVRIVPDPTKNRGQRIELLYQLRRPGVPT